MIWFPFVDLLTVINFGIETTQHNPIQPNSIQQQLVTSAELVQLYRHQNCCFSTYTLRFFDMFFSATCKVICPKRRCFGRVGRTCQRRPFSNDRSQSLQRPRLQLVVPVALLLGGENTKPQKLSEPRVIQQRNCW